MVSAKEVASSGLRGSLQEVRCVCEDGGEALSTTIVDVIKLARESIEIKCKNAPLSDQNTDIEDKLVDACAVGGTMRGQLVGAECLITALKMQSATAKLALEKLAGETSSREPGLQT